MIMSHDGETIQSLLKEVGVKKSLLALKLKKHPNTITNILSKNVLTSDQLIAIGKALRIDLTTYFAKLKKVPEALELKDFSSEKLVLGSDGITRTSSIEIVELRLEVKYLRDNIEQMKELVESKNQIIDMKDHEIELLKKTSK
jgi:hypothetical protein